MTRSRSIYHVRDTKLQILLRCRLWELRGWHGRQQLQPTGIATAKRPVCVQRGVAAALCAHTVMLLPWCRPCLAANIQMPELACELACELALLTRSAVLHVDFSSTDHVCSAPCGRHVAGGRHVGREHAPRAAWRPPLARGTVATPHTPKGSMHSPHRLKRPRINLPLTTYYLLLTTYYLLLTTTGSSVHVSI